MFRSIIKQSSNGTSSSREEETEDQPTDEDYWRNMVKTPSDDLDRFMWGSSGVPPDPAPPVSEPPKYQKNWAASPEKVKQTDGSVAADDDCKQADNSEGDDEPAEKKNDNILAAIETSMKDQKPPPIPDNIMLEDIVWKQRSGFGKYSLGILKHEWEQRRVVLFESGKLRYYELPDNMEGVTYDPSHAINPEKSPWVYEDTVKPRGEMDLTVRPGSDNFDDSEEGQVKSPSPPEEGVRHSFETGVRSLSSLVHTDKSPNVGGVKVRAREQQSDPGPTPFEIDITRKDTSEMWRFCFQSQSIQAEWLSMIKSFSSDEGYESDDSIDGVSDLANHGFEPGDHIIRWEMLPILYPIQIHGIVLEAGKNCVIIADFGLASYDNHRAAKEEGLTTWSGDEEKDDHDVIMAAWEKIKPKEKKRLNVNVVTDFKEIRKWSKVQYGEHVEKDKKPGFFKSLLPWEQKNTKKVDEAVVESDDESDGSKEVNQSEGDCAVNASADADAVSSAILQQIESAKNGSSDEAPKGEESNKVEGEPEWFHPGYRPRKRTESSSTIPINDEGQSVFSIDKPEDHAKSELPKSDSAKLVLARTHFILENEDLLPPYHVFYSNSECIAVWCKTGRWSTLQAAVYLVSSSVGFGKSATMLTISVAAAHAILVPGLAVVGAAVVGAPLLFLKKSQQKWEKATMSLTDEFWSRAEPEVFVEAIEYWAQWGKS
ncbi:hypothetical protein ACHAXR_004563 [Thalassiosira sp. AJA248-18]